VSVNLPKLPAPAIDTAMRDRLVDEAIESYVEWREECATVGVAYRCWSGERGIERTMSFAAYAAALDREECAARVYADAVGRVRRFLWPEIEPERSPRAA
jgi:hypothetical protein